MNKFIRPITISLSPNVEADDVRLAAKTLFSINKKNIKGAVDRLEAIIKDYFCVFEAITFNSGRSALWAILKSLNFNNNDEVLIQAFTCNAAVNPIIWSGLAPVYVDIDRDTFNIDPVDLEKKITAKSKAIIVQHTFGLPADMKRICEICERRGLMLIEDCAHSLGAEYKGKKVGTFGRAGYLSFSRDKIISSVYGGAVITNDKELGRRIKELRVEIGYPSTRWTRQQLLHPIIMAKLILPTYGIGGKYILMLLQSLRILSKAVHFQEKRGLKPGYFPKALPETLAIMALNQWDKLDRFNRHRQEIAEFYYRNVDRNKFILPVKSDNISQSYLRFAVKSPLAHKIIKKAWANNILIGDWYTNPVAPDDTILESVKYRRGSCRNAENAALTVLNLPTHINIGEKEARIIADFVNSCV